MLINKRARILMSILVLANVASAADIAVSLPVQDQVNYLGKINVNPLLKNQAGVIYAEERNLAKDLQIESIVKYFDCQTMAGAAFLEAALRLPVSPKSGCHTVARRQHAIATIAAKPELKARLDALLAAVKDAELDLAVLLSPEFRGASCPEEKELELLQATKNPAYPIRNFIVKNCIGNSVGMGINLIGTAGSAYATYLMGRGNYAAYKAGNLSGKAVGWNAYMAVAGGLVGYQVAKDYVNAYKKRNKMHAINKLINVAEEFELLCVENGIEPQFKMTDIANENSLSLIAELKKSRYSKARSYVFFTPKVHTFLYEIYEKDGGLADILACVAELDAYNAIATKLVGSQGQANKFCLANFINSPKAVINATGFWNVLVDQEKAVANNLYEAKNIILSGDNAGGKTTGTRSILQNIVLAQTFGVAAAISFEFTPFDIIHSYLNISDDLINGNSLFVSEVNRAKEIKEKIVSIDGTDLKFFFALDELFTGTSSEAGEECACAFVDRIATANGVMFIYPTHFDKLKKLGDSHDNCINYKVGNAVKRADGSLIYPFTISQGASYHNVAMDIANHANLFN